MRARIALVLSATLVAELCFASVSQTAPLVGGVLSFASDRGGSFALYQTSEEESTSSTATRLTVGGGDHLDPAWSLDGNRFAYARIVRQGTVSSIWRGGAGSEPTRLTSGAYDRQPSWSPNGARIAFVRSLRQNGRSRLYTISPSGGGARRLTSPRRGKRDWAPAWSPDGGQIAFASTRGHAAPDIYVMAANGSGVRPLTFSGTRFDGNPSWSPDGRIVFERCCPGGSSDLVMKDPATGEITKLTTTPEDEFDPVWSPDGLRIAFVRAPAGGGNRDLFTMAPDGTDVRRVSRDSRSDLAPSWRLHSACDAPDACSGDGSSTAGVDEEAPLDEPTPDEPSPDVPPTDEPPVEETPTDEPPVEETPTDEPPVEESPQDGVVEGAARAESMAFVAAVGPGRIRQRSRRIARGVTFIRRVHRRGPKRVFALKINPRRRPLDVALAGGRLRGFARTRSIARAHRALAAVNGDFALPNGSPVHAFAEDGSLKRTTLAQGRNFAISRNQRRAYAGRPQVSIVVGEGSGAEIRVTRWNDGHPVVGEVAAYTGAGSGVTRAPAAMCVARLRGTGRARWYGDRAGLERSYVVRLAGCYTGRVSRGRGNILLATRHGTPEAALVDSLRAGQIVDMRWSFGWPSMLDSIGGTPLLVNKGRVVARGCRADICRRHPRTAIGYTKRGGIILMVVDGRRRRWSVGMTLVELAREMRRLGAVGAVNLDGGGSSTMVVRGRIKNRPSDRRERPVSSAVLVLRRRDRGDPSPMQAVAPAGAVAPHLQDPASTGGLLDGVDQGTFGPETELPKALDEVVEDYRESHG